VFNRGTGSFDFTATSSAPYVTITPASGTLSEDTRLVAAVDWSAVPLGDSTATLTISGAGGEVVVQLPLSNPETPRPDVVEGFVEANGYVSMEAVHYTGKVEGAASRWGQVPDLGRTLSAVTPEPPNAPSVTPGEGTPRLDYKIHFFTAGQATVDVYLSPSLPILGSGLRYAVGFDGAASQTVNMHTDLPATFTDTAPAWEQWVSDNIIVKSTTHTITAGEHTLNLWMVDPGVVVQKIVVKTGSVPTSYLGPPARAPLNVELEVVVPEVPDSDSVPVDPNDSGSTDTAGPGGTPGGTSDTPGGTPTDPTSGTVNPGTTTGVTPPTDTNPGQTTSPGTSPSGTVQPGSTIPGVDTSVTSPGATDAGSAEDSGGCGCSIPGRSTPTPAGWLGAAFLLGGLVHGRRRLRR
jgi:hypothetical protein